MADATLNTDLPRRSILAVAAGASVFALNPSSVFPSAILPIASRADAPLLQKVTAAEQAWIALAEAGARCKALCRNTHAFENLTDETLSDLGGYRAAQARYDDASASFEAACDAAFQDPAQSLQGLHARLGFALRLTREYDILDHPPYDWLETALAELAGLAGVADPAGVADSAGTPPRNLSPGGTSYRAIWEARS